MRKLTSLAAAAVLTLGLVAPASAAPPERGEEFIWTILLDQEHGLVGFWNMSTGGVLRVGGLGLRRRSARRPPDPDHVGLRTNRRDQDDLARCGTAGAVGVERGRPPLTGPCEDTDDSESPWAAGSAMNIGTDNDLDHPASVENGLRRSNAFGERGSGSVTDGDGETWRYGWTFRAVGDNDGEFRDVVPFRTVLAPGG